MRKEGKQMFSVEYSESQKCLHVDDITKTIQTNRRKMVSNMENDWSIIGLFVTLEEAEDFAKRVKNKFI